MKILIKTLTLFLILFIFDSTIYAEPNPAYVVKNVVAVLSTEFKLECEKKVENDTVQMCACLADKSEGTLNQLALTQCLYDEDTKNECVHQVVADAVDDALNNESVNLCEQQVAAESQ